jgi:hypothetical protein
MNSENRIEDVCVYWCTVCVYLRKLFKCIGAHCIYKCPKGPFLSPTMHIVVYL